MGLCVFSQEVFFKHCTLGKFLVNSIFLFQVYTKNPSSYHSIFVIMPLEHITPKISSRKQARVENLLPLSLLFEKKPQRELYTPSFQMFPSFGGVGPGREIQVKVLCKSLDILLACVCVICYVCEML